MAEVFFTEWGRERLNEQDSETQERIMKKLHEIRDWPDHFLKLLKGRDDYVLRVSDYRVLIDWQKNDDEDGDTDDALVREVGRSPAKLLRPRDVAKSTRWNVR